MRHALIMTFRDTFWMMGVILLVVIPAVMLPINISKKFGKDTIFAILLLFFPYIGYAILGFGDARYQGGTTPAKY